MNLFGSSSAETYDEYEDEDDYEEVCTGPLGQVVISTPRKDCGLHSWLVAQTLEQVDRQCDGHDIRVTRVSENLSVITSWSDNKHENWQIGDVDDYDESELYHNKLCGQADYNRLVWCSGNDEKSTLLRTLSYFSAEICGTPTADELFTEGLHDLLMFNAELLEDDHGSLIITDNMEIHNLEYEVSTHDLIMWLHNSFDKWRESASLRWQQLRWVPLPTAVNPNEGNHDIVGGVFTMNKEFK